MTGERWKQVRDLFDAVLDQPVDQRDGYLAARSSGDPNLAQEVQNLLASYHESAHMLTQPAVKGLEALLPGGAESLERTSATTVIRTTTTSSSGGGAAVTRIGPYRLTGTISLDATGSLLMAARDDQSVKVKVFRAGMQPFPIRPRGLDHPNLVRLLDDGIGAEGLSYLVTEHIEGVPIDRYCDECQLGVTARLRLFHDICKAVQHAHRNLVVHGHLEPANILVTSDGVPKVFGFGLARPMDSPATSPDIRALGQLLRQLFPPGGVFPDELEALMAKAMAEDPQRSYASADALANEVAAYFEPASRRADELWTHHRAMLALAAVFALALVATTVASLYYATGKRRQALAAEQRFQDVRELARFILVDFDDALRQGETEARKALAPKALDYLNRLSASATSADPALQFEVAEGYLKIGATQQALRVAEALAMRSPANETVVLLAAKANASLGTIPGYRRALELLEPLLRGSSHGAAAQLQLEVSERLGFAELGRGSLAEAVAQFTRAQDVGARLIRARPNDLHAQRATAAALAGLGESYTRMGKPGDAVPKLTEALAMFERFHADNPTRPVALHQMVQTSLVLAEAQGAAGQPAEAVRVLRRALAVSGPHGAPAVMAKLAAVLHSTGATAEAHALTKRALDALWPLVDARDPQLSDLHQYVSLLVSTPFSELRSPARALPYAQQLVDLTKGSDPIMLDALAQAYFGSGDAVKAVETERKALGLLPPPKPGEPPSKARKDLENNLAKFGR